jgi:hypothetical protein
MEEEGHLDEGYRRVLVTEREDYGVGAIGDVAC